MAIEIVDFPIKNGGSFQFAMLVITRGYIFFRGFGGHVKCKNPTWTPRRHHGLQTLRQR